MQYSEYFTKAAALSQSNPQEAERLVREAEQPQFAGLCDWSLLDNDDKWRLMKRQPQLFFERRHPKFNR